MFEAGVEVELPGDVVAPACGEALTDAPLDAVALPFAGRDQGWSPRLADPAGPIGVALLPVPLLLEGFVLEGLVLLGVVVFVPSPCGIELPVVPDAPGVVDVPLDGVDAPLGVVAVPGFVPEPEGVV